MSETDDEFLDGAEYAYGHHMVPHHRARLFALARRGAEGWAYLKKGERRPVGQVLVAYHDKRELEFEKALMGDEAPIIPKLAIACWVKSHGAWMTRNLMVDGVYAWMPLPPPPAGETNDQ